METRKKALLIWQLSGFLFTSIFGAILHFLYAWSGYRVWVAPFSAVNESTWEHMKIFFFPSFIFALFQSFFFKKDAFWCIKLKGILMGLITIPTILYTYTGILGYSLGVINISIFFIACFLQYYTEYLSFKREKREKGGEIISNVVLFIIAILFIVFTFFPPRIALFQDPLSGNYGL